MSDYFDELAQKCIAQGAPEGFQVYEVALVGGNPLASPPAYTHARCKGGLYPAKTRGPMKGSPNWRKPFSGSEAEYYIDIPSRDPA